MTNPSLLKVAGFHPPRTGRFYPPDDTLGKPKPNDQLYQVYVQIERFRAAQYSKELSDKVFRGCVKIA